MRRLALVLIAGTVALVPGTAWAQTPPTPTSTVTGPVPQIPQGETYCPYSSGVLVPTPVWSNGQLTIPDPMEACAAMANQRQIHDGAKGFMDAVLPDDTGSKVPMSSYDVGSSAALSHGAGVVWGMLMSFCFFAATGMVSVGLLVLSWAMSFPFASIGSKVANEVAGLLSTKVIGPIGLGHFALLICVVVAFFHLIRGRAGRAVTEIATALAALMFASFILANPGALLRGAFRVESQVVNTILSLGQDTQPTSVKGTTPSSTLDSLKAMVVQTDVAKPYDLIDWGKALTGRCAAIRDEALSLGPWGDANAPRETMKKAPECAAAAAFNENPTIGRAFAAGMDMLNAVFSLGLLVILALALLAAQIAAVGIMGIAPLAIIAAIFPNPIRSAFWRWWEAAKRVVLVTMVSAAVLGFWAILMRSVMDQMAGDPLFLIFLAMAAMTVFSIVVAIAGFRRVPQIARNMTKTLEGKPGWVESRKSHGGAFGLGLGVMGLSDVAAAKRKMASLMPSRHSDSKKLVGAVHSMAGEYRALHEGWEPLGPYTGPDAPRGPGALVPSDGPWGDGRWHADAQHVDAERVPPRTDNATTRATMDEAQNRLANPYTRPTIVLPETGNQKVLTVGQRTLPRGGPQTPPKPASRLVKCGGCGATSIFTVPGTACPLCGHRN